MNCECDDQLAFSLIDLMDSADLQYFTNADGSGFDHAGHCHAVANQGGVTDNITGDQTNADIDGGDEGPVTNELKCCGTYPQRFEFFTHGGSRACCGENTYNSNKLECCEGDFLGQIGSCDLRRK